jgi:uncharacterized membrane protein YraQ (UPF0718 family)
LVKYSKKFIQLLLVGLFAVVLGVSFLFDYEPGIRAGQEFYDVIIEMLKILPCAFILIALFEQWVKQETVIRHLGNDSGVRGYLWALLLGSMTVGGLYVAFPLAYTLRKKGASLKVVFSFLGFAGVCRIPMTLFEVSFLGLKFTLIRLTVAIFLMLITGIILGSFLEKRDYQIQE